MKVTYLFGAGASCATLPLASELGRDIEEVLTQITADRLDELSKGTKMIPMDQIHQSKRQLAENLFDDFKWLSQTSRNHYTIDTIARKLWMRGDNEQLEKLKNVLTCYLWYKQLKNPSDKRYDSFLATLLQKDKGKQISFPENIALVTWNYDSLLERAFYEYCLDYSYIQEQVILKNRVSHLNGIAEVYPINEVPSIPNDYKKFPFSLYEKPANIFSTLYEMYTLCKVNNPTTKLKTKLSFAWENEKNVEETIPLVKNTSTLVIIGYSFPFFNRRVDLQLLASIIPTLDTIYLQVNGNIGARERLVSILHQVNDKEEWNKIINEKLDTEYFTIPDELVYK